VSQENVEIVLKENPGPELDLVQVFRDDARWAARAEARARIYHPDVEYSRPGLVGGKTFTGLDGLRAGWLDWLTPWATYTSRGRKRHRPRRSGAATSPLLRTPRGKRAGGRVQGRNPGVSSVGELAPAFDPKRAPYDSIRCARDVAWKPCGSLSGRRGSSRDRRTQPDPRRPRRSS
jgi:hypothetical protein